MRNLDEVIADRPKSLTEERARSFLPEHRTNPEWQRKHDAGELGDGIQSLFGMLDVIWPDVEPTEEEAKWLLELREFGSWRWFSSIVLHGDDTQSNGTYLEEAAQRVLGSDARVR